MTTASHIYTSEEILLYLTVNGYNLTKKEKEIMRQAADYYDRYKKNLPITEVYHGGM